VIFRIEKIVEVGKKISHRPKERIAFVQNALYLTKALGCTP